MKKSNSITNPMLWSSSLVLAAILAGCGGSSSSGSSVKGPGPVGALCSGTSCVDLGSTATYVILADSAISNTPTSAIKGDMGISPGFGAAITGFALTVDAKNDFSTSPQVTGRIYAPDYTGGQTGSAGTTPALMTAAHTDKINAYNAAAAVTPASGAPNLDYGAGTVTGYTFTPGTWTWNSNVDLTGDNTISGSSTDVFIFQVNGTLHLTNGKKIILSGGALPENIFWVVSGATTIGTTAQFQGILMDATAITLGTGATVKGRLQSQTAVTLDGNTVTVP